MDWVQFLEDNSVPYVTRGANTKRGEVSVKCPFCSEDDPSEHLGISLTKENWGCLRNQQHRGHSPITLIQALLGTTWGQAKLVSEQYSKTDPESLDSALAALGAAPNAPGQQNAPVVTLPPVRAIKPEGLTAKFWRYLETRGFDDVAAVARCYGLVACVTGETKDRLVIPFYQNGELVGWTARALVNPISAPRYLSSAGDAIKRTVFNEDELYHGGELLFIVEGPFDALKMDWYGMPLGARATCVFGTSVTMDQISILNVVRKLFKRVVILLDRDAVEPTFHLAEWLNAPNVMIGQLPSGADDPGELNNKQIIKLVRET